MFVDTHCHMNMMVEKKRDEPLRSTDFEIIEKIIAQSKQKGVSKFLNVGTSLAETKNSLKISQRFDNVWATAGIHPCDATKDWKADFEEIKKLVQEKKSNKIVGIGETGLDFFHKPFDKDLQADVFQAHIELALEHDLALTVHVRESADEVLKILEKYKNEARGVIHCFMQKEYVAQTVCEWGWFLGIDGPITYPKNEWLRTIVKQVGIDHIVLETDAPFLPPQEYRGKQNGPCYLPIFAQTVADLCGISLEKCAKKTTENVKKLWNI